LHSSVDTNEDIPSLIEEIIVDENGSFNMPKTCKNKNDATGGIEFKIKESIEVALAGVEVYFALAGSLHALQACLGFTPEKATHMHLANFIRQ